jgi:N-acetylneuraminic acid mutarotase
MYSSSPLAIAIPGEPDQLPTPRRSLPFWAIIITITGLVLIILLGTALIYTRRSPNATIVQQPVQTIFPRWTQSEPLPKALFGASSVTFGGKLYLIGGRNDDQTLSDLLCYDPSIAGWSDLKGKPTAVSETNAVVIQENIYIPGGRLANGKPTNLLEMYNFQANSWETRHPMPKTLMGSAIAAVDGTLFVIGGWDGETHSRSVYIYNRESDEWAQGKDLPFARSYMAVSVIEGYIQLIGGETQDGPITDNLIYYPGRDIPGGNPYEAGVSLPQPRSRASSVVLTNITYLFGGTGGSSNTVLPPIALVQSQTSWTVLDGVNPVNAELQSVLAAGNYIHLFGGKNGQTAVDSHGVYQAIYTITLPLTTN